MRRATEVEPAHRRGLRISIHALREESDLRPCGIGVVAPISIHALREESDSAGRAHLDQRHDFNPRSP